MDDTPYLNDGADASLRKTVSLLNKIEANTASSGGSGGGLTNAELRASPVPVSGTVTANTGLSQPLTDAQLRSSAVPVSGTVGVSGTVPVSGTFWQATQPVSGTVGISGTVPVSGTFWQATQPVSVASALSTRVAGWDIPVHDYRDFGYTSGNLTSITYKTGGAGGTTVATLTLVYDGSGNLTSMTKT